IEAQGSGGNTGYGQLLPVAHAHHGALAKLAFDLAEGGLQCFFLVGVHWIPLSVTWRSVMAPAGGASGTEHSAKALYCTTIQYCDTDGSGPPGRQAPPAGAPPGGRRQNGGSGSRWRRRWSRRTTRCPPAWPP